MRVLRSIADYFSILSCWQRHILYGIAFVLLLTQLSTLVYFISQVSDSRAVITSFDNDGANAIDVAARSRWYNDNDFSGYGNLYFRLSNTLSALIPGLTEPGAMSPEEARSKSVHFALLIVSLLAIYGLSLLLAKLLHKNGPELILTAILFAWFLLHSKTWAAFLLRAHPDHLLALLVASATALSFRSWDDPKDKYKFRLAAWGWGLALATKMSVILFLPFVLVSHMPRLAKSKSRRALVFTGHVAAIYFLIGFPQNFRITRTIKFLVHQSAFSKPATLDSLFGWLALWVEQFSFPLILVVGGMLAIRPFITSEKLGLLWRAGAVALGPFFLMLAQNIIPSHDHYLMPVIACQLVLLINLKSIGAKIPPAKAILPWTQILGIVLIFTFFGAVPKEMNLILQGQLGCRDEARAMFRELSKFSASDHQIFAAPYVPTLDKMKGVRSTFRPNVEYIVHGAFDVIALNRRHFEPYIKESSEYISKYNPDWRATREFYMLFEDKEILTGSKIGSWQKVYADDCGGSIWKVAD